jgi:hypothetical protein
MVRIIYDHHMTMVELSLPPLSPADRPSAGRPSLAVRALMTGLCVRGWPWSGLLPSCVRAAPAVAVHRRSGATCFGDVARIRVLESEDGGCQLGS